ncbi:MAG: hypothetical protein JSS83_03920 [Cyanobacteria bacterium SZAS LIN-3]|nr:hypothetical protein [Cyanobacteria bacterium SZAS LIN-3]
MTRSHIQLPKTIAAQAFNRFGHRLFLSCLAFGLTVSAFLGMSSVAWAADARPTIPASELTAILREPNVGAKATNIQVVGTGPDVTVMAQKESNSGERDLKIDAIFLAKALFQHASGQVSKVKVLFSQAGHDGRYVTISSKEILDYGSGKITAEQLLSALRLTPVAAEKAPDVVAGPQFERRLLVWQRIEKLRQQGTGVEPFEAIFTEIDGMVKAGKDDPTKKLSFLESKLAEQEEALNQAKRTARGLGVPASKNSFSSSVPSSSMPSAGSASHSNQSTQSSSFLPSDHLIIRQMYDSKAEGIISLAKTKNRSGAEELITLKRQIDTAFSQGRKPEAFALMKRFQDMAKQLTNTDMFAPPGEGPMGGQGGPMGGPGGGPNGVPGGGPP